MPSSIGVAGPGTPSKIPWHPQPRTRARPLTLHPPGAQIFYIYRKLVGVLGGQGPGFFGGQGNCSVCRAARAAHRAPASAAANAEQQTQCRPIRAPQATRHGGDETPPQRGNCQPGKRRPTNANKPPPLASWHPESAGGAWGCSAAETEHYLNHTLRMGDAVASGLEKAAFESTTDYVWVSPGPRADAR